MIATMRPFATGRCVKRRPLAARPRYSSRIPPTMPKVRTSDVSGRDHVSWWNPTTMVAAIAKERSPAPLLPLFPVTRAPVDVPEHQHERDHRDGDDQQDGVQAQQRRTRTRRDDDGAGIGQLATIWIHVSNNPPVLRNDVASMRPPVRVGTDPFG